MDRLEDSELSNAPTQVLQILSKLGKGSYGSVFKARHKRTGRIVAVKKVPVDSDLSEIVKEISIMQQCDSPYIVKCHGSLFDDHDLWICMEYCGAGSVADIMRLRNKTLQEQEIGTILKDSLLGLEYLHQMRKIHRDVKAGNILLTNSGMIKLADFGVAGQLADTLAKRNTVIGTPYWMAPEVIQEIGYNCSADIWSLGITAIEMADGKPPLGDEHPMRALFMIPSQPSPRLRNEKKWSSTFVFFINSCLSKSPEGRPTASELLEMEFIRVTKPCSILMSLIEESNKIRDKRLEDSRMARKERRGSEISDEFAEGSLVPPRPSNADEDNNCGTIIHTSGRTHSLTKSIEKTHLDPDFSGTIISNNSAGGSRKMKDDKQSASTSFRNGGDVSELLGTMVINDSSDDEFEMETGSVLVHDTQNSASKVSNQFFHGNASSPGDNGDTLTRSFDVTSLRSGNCMGDANFVSYEDTAAAVAAAQRDCGVVGVAPIPQFAAQRPFAPFSRAFQESGFLGGQFEPPSLCPDGVPVSDINQQHTLALANEPGGLAKLSYSELEHLLVNLGRDLETELRNLAVRYRHKRQPLLDAIAEKSALSEVLQSSGTLLDC